MMGIGDGLGLETEGIFKSCIEVELYLVTVTRRVSYSIEEFRVGK